VTPILLWQGYNYYVGIHCRYTLTISLVRMLKNSVNSVSSKDGPHLRVQRTRFFINWLKLWQFDHTVREFWAYFYYACAETAIKELPVKNLTPPFARRPRFPTSQMHFHYRVMFTGYIPCFFATTSHDLVTLTFDLLTLKLFHVQFFSCPTYIPINIILWLSVTELRELNIWSHFRYLKQSLRMRRVTW